MILILGWSTLVYMGIHKRVSRHVRFDYEADKRISEIVQAPGEKQTYSAFVRNAVDLAIRQKAIEKADLGGFFTQVP